MWTFRVYLLNWSYDVPCTPAPFSDFLLCWYRVYRITASSCTDLDFDPHVHV